MMLYVAMVGGQLPGHRIEVHDIEIYLAEDQADLVEQCRAFVRPIKARHIDGWIEIPVGPNTLEEQKLYLLEMGKNETGRFYELHDYVLVCAENTRAAIFGAKSRAKGWHVDTVIDLTRAAADRGHRLDAASAEQSARFISRYIRL
jgi:Domain of Unknown Function (DUF1543)